ncbi:MAG: peptidylprolyl isomerase [Saprospiraceae bacterium]|nr:peptidylprolyl isomerase [Saprospiraceae bacterium]
MNKIIISILCLLVGETVTLAQKRSVDKIIAKVGSEIILYSDWQEQISFIGEKQGSLNKNDECSVLENILIQKFMVHQAKLDSVEINDEEVETQLTARVEQILQYMGNDVKKFEEYYGQSVSEVRERFREDLKSQLLTERLQTKVLGNITVTPNETEKFFQSIPKDSIPYFNSEVEIAEILIRPVPNEEQMQKAKDKLNKISNRIRAGEDFAKLASLLSEDVGSGKQGGSLGWLKRGTLVPEYEAAAYRLEQDSLSAITQSEFGFHLIQLLGRRGNTINTRHILIKPELSDGDITKAKNELDSVRNKIIKDSIPFEIMVRKHSDKKSETYNYGGQLVNPKTGNSYFEIADLDPDVYFAVDNLKVGEISKIVESKDQEGKKYFRIFKLISRTPPHKANLLQDYAKIQIAAKEQKKNEKFREWLNVHIPKIYSDVDAGIVGNCPNLQVWTAATKRG